MRATNSPRRNPSGFTLIELLVVISIIGILMGLLLGAVQKVRTVGQRTAAVTEINQLDAAVTKFKLDAGFNPPQRIRLPGVVPLPAWSGGTAQQQECLAGFKILLQMFPRWQLPAPLSVSASQHFNDTTNNLGVTPTGIKYCSTLATPSVVVATDEGLLLEGSQCLVFFLGGPELRGFIPSGPYSPAAGATSAKLPYFDFVVSRMNNTASPAPAKELLNGYLDSYGTPYAYLSTYTANNYDLNYAWTPPTPASGPAYANPMRAYQEVSGKPINPGRIQIISAGRNKRFGPGTVYVPGPPASYLYWRSPTMTGYQVDGGAPAGDGGDDLANFNGGAQLGVTGN